MDKTFGVIGLGNIGQEVLNLTQPLGMKHIACDPYATADVAAKCQANLVDLDSLMQTADFVCVCCALSDSTRGLIGAEQIGLMKPTAFLINVARGPIVDQPALTAALQEHQIAGAGLDVFEREPIDDDDPLLSLENVIVTPHALSWTDQCFQGIGRCACDSILDVAGNRVPTGLVNPTALEHPRWKERLK